MNHTRIQKVLCKGLFIGVICLCLSALLISPVTAADPDWPTQEKLLKAYGTQLMEKAPKGIQEGTRLQQAQYVYTQWCELLKNCEGMVNCNALTRVLISDSQFTCSWHATRLQAVMEGWGIDENDMSFLIADSDSLLPTPNSDHGALSLRDNDGRIYVFDPWKMATEQYWGWPPTKLYSSAANSPYNGMPVGTWGDIMTKAGYVRFSGDLADSWEPTADQAAKKRFNPTLTVPQTQSPGTIEDPCKGCDVRRGWEILGYDMSYCDKCDNDEYKTHPGIPRVKPIDCTGCDVRSLYESRGDDMSHCDNCPNNQYKK